MEAERFDLGEGTAILERTPRVLHAQLADLPTAWLHADEGPDTWSPFQVVGHLITGEERDWMARARIILSDADERRFEPFDRFRHLRAHHDVPITVLLERFADLRRRNLADIEALTLGEDQLARTGIHPEFGEVTLRQLLATWVAHDLGHLVQVHRVLARRYRHAVGPWAAYLSVMES